MSANGGQAIVQGFLEPNGREQISGLNVVKGLTTVPAFSKVVMIQPQTQNIRWRDDGVNPSATVGMILVANDVLVYSGDMSALKFIETTPSAKINVNFYK